MAEEGGLPQLIDTLRGRWTIFVPVTLLVGALAVFYVESLPPVYTAQAVVAFAPRPEADNAGADTVRVVVPKYVAYITAPATIAEVATETVEQPGVLGDALRAELAADTGNVMITVEMNTPQRAARAANAFAEEVLRFASGDELLTSSLVARALPPRQPSGPPRRLLEAAALCVGTVLGIAFAALAEAQRPRIRTWMDMTRLTGQPVIGRVPSSRKLKTKPMEALSDPGVGSAFRTLRTNIEREAQNLPRDLIVVTSPSEGEGKTTIAGLFAESLARVGTKVLLIDADLRRPQVARSFKVQTKPGFAEVLRGSVPLTEAIQPGWTEGLSVVATDVDNDAADLLARRFLDVMSEARTLFDAIIVDTTPIVGIADARGLAAVASGVLLVVSARRMADPLNEAILALETVRAPILGIVGNRLREPKHAYRYLRPA